MLIIKYRVKDEGEIIGYIVEQYKTKNEFYITADELASYEISNAI